MKKVIIIAILMFFVIPLAMKDSSATTCGLTIGHGAPLNFGSLSIGDMANSTSPGSSTGFLNFTNNGDGATATVTVAGTNWVSGGITHITGEHTRFSTTDQGPSISYTSKHALNSTNTAGPNSDGFVTFGDIIHGTNVNDTQWALQAVLTNLPFSGLLTQTITFSATC